ncbi:MAG: prepilin peptidase [Acidobacteria bacterium]|nr:prepilin peptidase [Acidobacteriota bacterium]
MEVGFALAFGLIAGSFLNVCILRIPRGMSISKPRSHCPQCKKLIPWHDNVPIVSYLVLGGRCRRCRKKISARYPLIEALSGLVSVLLYLKFGFGAEWFIFLPFSSALLVLAFIDLDHRILPDPITLNGIWIGVLVNIYLVPPSPLVSRLLRALGIEAANPRLIALVASLLGMAVGGGLLWAVAEAYLRLRGIEGMGFGDVKMMAMVGAFLGAPLALLTIMIGSLLGSIIGLAFMRFAGKTREYELPFGTFLSLAGIVAVLYGEDLVRLYVDRFVRPGI